MLLKSRSPIRPRLLPACAFALWLVHGMACGGSHDPASPMVPPPASEGVTVSVPSGEELAAGAVDVPPIVLTSMNINPDTEVGPNGSALYIVDVERGDLFVFPFSSIEGGPVVGQGMHTALTPDREKLYVTIGGNLELPLRVVVIELDWDERVPTPRVVKTLELVEEGTPGNPANGAACHPGGQGVRQEGHGTRITDDGRFLLLSELQNDRVRVLDIGTDTFVSEPTTHEGLFAPHGLYPNPAGTVAAVPAYWFDRNDVMLFDVDPETGGLTYARTIYLVDEVRGLRGSYLHSVRWLDDTRFYVDATQERDQGDGQSEQSVWFVDLGDDSVRAVLSALDLLEGVSDLAIANGKLYAAEGNVAQLLAGEEAPGHVSVWDITDPSAPSFVTRLSAGSGLPDDFDNAHSLGTTAAGEVVFVESFSSDYLIEIETDGDTVVRVFSESEGLDVPHGIYLQPSGS